MEGDSKQKNTAPKILPMLPSGRALIVDSFNLFKKRFMPLMLLTILPLMATIAGTLLFTAISAFMDVSSALKLILLVVGILALFVIQIFAQIAVYEVILRKGTIDLRSVLISAKGKVLSYLGTAFLYIAILVGGFLLFIVPGFIFLVWFMFSLIIVVDEEKPALDALKQSKEYTVGYFGSLVARWLFLFFVFVLFFIAISIFSSAIFKGSSSAESFTGALAVIVSPIGSIYFVKLYQALKGAKIQN